MAKRPDRCTVPGCNGEIAGNLVLSDRYKNVRGHYVAESRITRAHVYLCERHMREMDDFLSCYRGGGAK